MPVGRIDSDDGKESAMTLMGVPDGERSESIAEIAKALAAAQGQFGPIKKTKTAKIASDKGAYSYDYADLADVIAVVKGPLQQHGLAFTQSGATRFEVADGRMQAFVSVTGLLVHESGEWMRFGPFELPSGGSAQAFGSAMTYARRYQLSAALGIASEADDDGASAGSTSDRSGKATEQQMRAIHALASAKGRTHNDLHDWVGVNLGIESMAELSRSGAKVLREALEALPDVENVEDGGIGDVGIAAQGGSETPSSANGAALKAEALRLAGSQKELLDYYRDEFRIEGTVSTKDLTPEVLSRLIEVLHEIHGEPREEAADSS